MTPPGTDAIWRELAENSREALGLLGYTISPQCLPGEGQACGGTYAQHAAAHLSALKAVTDHHLLHMSPGFVAPIFSVTYAAVDLQLTEDCQLAMTGRPHAPAEPEGAPDGRA